jgi:hypothetical protein
MPETDHYLPIKRHLEFQGYTFKAEVKGCDVVALREPMSCRLLWK